jgi:hypothetical protein
MIVVLYNAVLGPYMLLENSQLFRATSSEQVFGSPIIPSLVQYAILYNCDAYDSIFECGSQKTSLKSGLAPQSELNAEQQLTCHKYNKQIYNKKILQTVQIDS